MAEGEKVIRTKTGRVVSNKMHKTVVVEIMRLVKHTSGKYVKRFTRLFVHDEDNVCQEGDTVVVKECRPLSRHKAWTLVQVLKKATQINIEAK
jgi:small subunit ribosomal protein S17